MPSHGNLEAWARSGVLLLNTILTVEAHKPMSHSQHGWEIFTDTVIKKVSYSSNTFLNCAGQRKKAASCIFALGRPCRQKSVAC